MIHPTDQRYLVKELIPFFSEEGFLEYKIKVEKAYVRALNKIGVCPDEIADEIMAQTVTALEVEQSMLRPPQARSVGCGETGTSAGKRAIVHLQPAL